MALQTAELYRGFNNQEWTLKRSKVVRLPPLEDAPFVFLRQMGYEVLKSPGVRGLLSIYY